MFPWGLISLFFQKGEHITSDMGQGLRLTNYFFFYSVFTTRGSCWPKWLGHFGYIHLLSVLTIATVPYSLWQLKRGRLISHQRSMQFLYWTGLLIAGGFTLFPGRYLHGLIFG